MAKSVKNSGKRQPWILKIRKVVNVEWEPELMGNYWKCLRKKLLVLWAECSVSIRRQVEVIWT